jgi:hypothetical protein
LSTKPVLLSLFLPMVKNNMTIESFYIKIIYENILPKEDLILKVKVAHKAAP